MSKPVYTNAQQREILRVFPELVRARELLLDLVWKDLRVRYRYAFMGFFWAILEPLLMTLILTFVFSYVFRARIERLGIESGPGYAVFILAGLIPWQFLSASLTTGTRSLVENRNLVQKLYFPREIIPLATVGNAMVNLAIGFVLLMILFTLLVQPPGIGALYMIALMSIQLAMTVGLVLLLSCANVLFRDVSYMVEVAILFGFYGTPVFYPPSLVAENAPGWYALYMLNPMAGLLTTYRDVLWHNTLSDWTLLVSPVVCAVLFLGLGLWWFRRNSPEFSDYL